MHKLATTWSVIPFAFLAGAIMLAGCLSAEPGSGADMSESGDDASQVDPADDADQADPAGAADQNPKSGQIDDAIMTSSATRRVDACFSGACGSATYTRTSSNSYSPISMSVKDNKCDGHPVYIQAGVVDGTFPTGYVWLNTKHYNHLGCHGGYAVWNSYLKDWHLPIRDLIFRVCVDDAGSDTCKIAL
jgi:hypothetical protein